ncbi:type I restriction endonuclease subunit M, partial [Pseudoalteromonas sp. S979]|uniref:N-6 DNA methylase n=1 Tax=Pseudoalteromonas sp. S979 TaxID=579570 RepID=UPI001485E916
DILQPQLVVIIYDGAAGWAGVLCEAFDFLRQGGACNKPLSSSDLITLQENSFYAQEKKSVAYVIAIMHMILHGIDAPNV